MSSHQPSMWQQNYQLFRRLYVNEGRTLKKVKEIVESQCGFPETPLWVYEEKLRDELKLKKNLRARDWPVIGRHLELWPPDTNVFFQDVMIPRRRVRKYIRRNKQLISQQSELPRLPDGIRFEGPVNASGGSPVAESWLAADLPGDEIGTSEPSCQLSVTDRPPPPSTLSHRASMSMDRIFNMLIPPGISDIPAASIQYSLPILDPDFAVHLTPLLDNIPIIRFQSTVRDFLERRALPSGSVVSFTEGFVSLRELEQRDALDLGLRPIGAGDYSISPTSEYPNSPNMQLSRFDNPFHIISFILHQLSNLAPLRDLLEAMRTIPDQILGFEFLFKMLIGLHCLTVRAASYSLLVWIRVIDNEKLFRIFAEAMLQQHSAAWFYQTHRLHGPLLVLAARFGFSTTCGELIKNGVSPNQTVVFPNHHLCSFQPTRHTSALAEAAKMGNVDTVKILLDFGADVNFASRDYGSVAAVNLLFELQQNSLYRRQRLEILRLLFERGLDIDARHWGRLNTPHWATEYTTTILDHVILDGDEDVAAIFNISCVGVRRVPTGSVGEIISHARMGSHELKDYLRNATASPKGSATLIRAQKVALRWAIERGNTKVVLAMVRAGFDLRDRSSNRFAYKNYLDEVFRNAPISPISSQLAFALLDSDQGPDVEAALIQACLGSPHDNVIEFIFDNSLGLVNATGGAILLACAARLGQFTSVRRILQLCPAALDEKTEFWNSCHSALFMSAATFATDGRGPRLLMTLGPASIEMLDFLLQREADTNACHPRFWSSQQWIQGNQLAWLVDNLAHFNSLEGISVYRMIFPTMEGWFENRFTEQGIGQNEKEVILKLHHRFAVPIFSAGESKLLHHRRYFETKENPLSFFISLEPGHDFSSQVIDAGVDINGAGSCSDPDRTNTPLRTAVQVYDFNLVKLLVSKGAEIRKTEPAYLFTTLQLAVCTLGRTPNGRRLRKLGQSADPRIVEFLLQQGADPNGRAKLCCVSPLQMADNPHIVQHLLDNGANPREMIRRCPYCEDYLEKWHHRYLPLTIWDQCIKSMGLLHFTVLRYLRTPTEALRCVVELLVSRGADIDERLFDVSIRTKKVQMAFTALEVAAGAVRRTILGYTLHADHDPWNIAMVELLLSYKAQINPPSTYWGPSALAIACDVQDLQMVRVLLRHGASPNPHIPESPPPWRLRQEIWASSLCCSVRGRTWGFPPTQSIRSAAL